MSFIRIVFLKSSKLSFFAKNVQLTQKNRFLFDSEYLRRYSVKSDIYEISNNEGTSLKLFEDIDYDKITNGNDEKLSNLKRLILEIDLLYEKGEQIPSKLKTDQWMTLLDLNSRSSRMKHLRYLFLIEKKKENRILKKLEQRAERLERYENMPKNDHIEYGLMRNTMFHRIYETQMNSFYNYRLCESMLYGQNIIIDCSYDGHMSIKEQANCAKQLLLMWSSNRIHKDPFNITFCNVNKEGRVFKHLSKTLPTMDHPTFPFNYTNKSYLDLFPRNKLVYLTPHCNEILDKFNYDDIYIIGAMVDKMKEEPLSLAKAKRDKVRMAKLPLDIHLDWKQGSKNLTINQMVMIMADLKIDNNWLNALLHIPRRKILEVDAYQRRHLNNDNRLTAKHIREKFRKNSIYDLLIKKR
ncbi:mitochondrial ribonuclease P protein 1 homolog [Daktulosphaira vitifoliae]|uniref:mitochondrial ribonuclease P protein 1 homolog n=1 Tax=Daktulosphaira vitifoliae TaxID=58002 RepID=UPI0021A9ED73|nr:mitochondrial ribonuclease P protein 1 homolog [Daktulosphaira vitifoliae]XP_050538557.1 mitochondrial ribonuclease P protein 1 homolog [Daktulosphaira vitifoliae]